VVTQDAIDLFASDFGQAVVANAASQLLLGQAPRRSTSSPPRFACCMVSGSTYWPPGSARGILAAGTERVAFRAEASPAEHALVTTTPEFLASLERSGENSGVIRREPRRCTLGLGKRRLDGQPFRLP
jgi:hypothetical protein